jgi:hypothetical protein
MPVEVDFGLVKYEDGLLTLTLTPPTDVSQWPVRFTLSRRFGSENPLVRKYNISGMVSTQSGAYVSGVAAINPSQGVFGVEILGSDLSGQQPSNYAFAFERLSSGYRTVLARGYLTMTGGGIP